MTGSTILAEIQKRHAADATARAELNARQRAAYRAAREQTKASLPHVRFEPPVVEPEPGRRYVMATTRVEAWDPVDERPFVAAVPGTWVRAEYAEALGLTGEPVALVWRPA